MAQFPALPLWTDAYLGDTTHLTTFEHGAYLLLLMVAWRTRDCALPDDDALLARYARTTADRWKKIRPTILSFFDVEDGKLIQKRLRDERSHVIRVRQSRSAGGRAKALNNKKRHDAQADAQLCYPTPTPTPTKVKDKSFTKSKPVAVLPDWLPAEAWNGWLEMRKAKRVPNTERAMKLAINKLEALRAKGYDPGKVLDEATEKGWQGIYEPGDRRGDGLRDRPRLTL